MITEIINGDIFTTEDKHIIFGINTEGYNDSGFAGVVSRKYWPELANTGGNKLGEVLEKTVDGITYHAIVCHSLDNGWGDSPVVIKTALNKMQFTESASIIVMGAGFVGKMQGAPVEKIMQAYRECDKKLNLYML